VIKNLLLVALGAVPGAWLRFRLVNYFEPMLPRKHWSTLGVNVGASFALGLLVGLAPGGSPGAAQMLLLLGTGFLGSLSTFSTFIAEIFLLLQADEPREAALLCAASVLLGLLAVAAGLALGAAP
jgi:CrcB protein